MSDPPIQYTTGAGVSVAYRVLGDAPIDMVVVPGFVSHLEIMWENPAIRRLIERLSRFARLIIFDKRGTGLSDPVAGVPTLEERMDDLRAVMDAVGSEHAALVGVSEGAPMSILFAATYPERVDALVLWGGMARTTWAPDYPWATPKKALIESAIEFLGPARGTGDNIEVFAPDLASDPAMRDWWGRLERNAVSPAMMMQLVAMFFDIDVRDALPLVQAPTLVLHRRGDRVVNVGAGRWLAEHIPGARFVELPGRDHPVWAGDPELVAGEIEELLTGSRAASTRDVDRILATVMFTDVVGSTDRAATVGDRRWRDLLEKYYAAVRRQLSQFGGVEVKTVGDGMLARFDGPARSIRCAQAINAAMPDIGLQTRIGLHSGECDLLAGDLGGIAVHIAARVAALADAGEVLVSRTVKDLVAGSGISFSDRGLHRLRGVPDEWQLFAVERAS